MVQMRCGVFETNSSSTHSISMCMKSDYDAWVRGEAYFNNGGSWSSYSIYKDKDFVTKEQVIDILTDNKYPLASIEDLNSFDNEVLEEIFYDHEIYTHDNYKNDYLEWFKKEFTTPTGDVVIAFGQYGYEG